MTFRRLGPSWRLGETGGCCQFWTVSADFFPHHFDRSPVIQAFYGREYYLKPPVTASTHRARKPTNRHSPDERCSRRGQKHSRFCFLKWVSEREEKSRDCITECKQSLIILQPDHAEYIGHIFVPFFKWNCLYRFKLGKAPWAIALPSLVVGLACLQTSHVPQGRYDNCLNLSTGNCESKSFQRPEISPPFLFLKISRSAIIHAPAHATFSKRVFRKYP